MLKRVGRLKIWEKAPAKINLTLDVLGKREDGFHEVEMIMTMVDLADRISFEECEDGQIALETNSAFIPTDERNIVYKAAQLLRDELSIDKGVHIFLDKKIPIAAGLGGGSSDAAATLRGLNNLWQLNLTVTQLQEYGAKLGSDVPFCVAGGTVIARGRGELLEQLPPMPAGWILLAKPSVNVSTRVVYGKLDYRQIEVHPETEKMREAIVANDLGEVAGLLCNVLQPVTFSLYPEVAELASQMEEYGVDNLVMSGSGPTLYTLSARETGLYRIYNALRGFCEEVYMVRLLR